MPDERKEVAKIGRLTRDPVLRYANNGKAVADFGFAENPPWVPQGAPKPEPRFYEVTAWDTLAVNASETLKKGYRIVVIGVGKTETWMGNDGKEHSKKVITADGLGPDLRFVTADIHQAERAATAEAAVPDDDRPF